MPVPATGSDPLLDFRNFLFVIWKHLSLPTPTKRQYEFAQFLQTCPNRRRMIRAFRGAGKSWVCYAYICWRLYCDQQVNILVISASKAKADEFSTFVRQLISEVPVLQHLKAGAEQRWSNISFDVRGAEPDPNPSVKSAGITGQIVGSRADEVVFDDVETAENSATQLMREKLEQRVKEAESILKPLTTSRITYLGTPQCEDSLYNKLPAKGYAVRIWPALYPDSRWMDKNGEWLAPEVAAEITPANIGKTTEPTRFTDEDLARRAIAIGRSTFALQFMLDSSLADEDRYPLRMRDLIVTPLDPNQAAERYAWAAVPDRIINDLPNVGLGGDRMYRPVPLPQVDYLPYEQKVMSIDPSGRGQDETGYAIGGSLHGLLFLLDAGGFHDGSSDSTLLSLAHLAAKYKVGRIIVEANFGDGMYTKLLQPVVSKVFREAGLPGCTIEEVKHSKQKELRIIDTLEPVVASHRLVVNADLIQRDYDSVKHLPEERSMLYRLFYQLTRITREKGSIAHDDRLDALAILIAFFTAIMAVDSHKAQQASHAKAIDAEIRSFINHVFNIKAPQSSGRWATRA
jgi:hypothetical protein